MESAVSAGSVAKYTKDNSKMENLMDMVEKSTIISTTKACSREELNVAQEDACGTLAEKMEVSEIRNQIHNFYLPISFVKNIKRIHNYQLDSLIN